MRTNFDIYWKYRNKFRKIESIRARVEQVLKYMDQSDILTHFIKTIQGALR